MSKDGKVAKIQGDPDCPINHGTLCSKGLAAAEIAYHPDRLTLSVQDAWAQRERKVGAHFLG